MFRKLGVVLLLVMCIVGFSMNSATAQSGKDYGRYTFNNTNGNFNSVINDSVINEFPEVFINLFKAESMESYYIMDGQRMWETVITTMIIFPDNVINPPDINLFPIIRLHYDVIGSNGNNYTQDTYGRVTNNVGVYYTVIYDKNINRECYYLPIDQYKIYLTVYMDYNRYPDDNSDIVGMSSIDYNKEK